MRTPDNTFAVHGRVGVVVQGDGEFGDDSDLGLGTGIATTTDHRGKLAFGQGTLGPRESCTPAVTQQNELVRKGMNG